MILRLLLATILLTAPRIPLLAQIPAGCDCISLPSDENCWVYCLKRMRSVPQLQKLTTLSEGTASAIINVKNPAEIRTLSDYKKVLPKAAYDELNSKVTPVNIVNSNIQTRNSGQTIGSVSGNVNIYNSTPDNNSKTERTPNNGNPVYSSFSDIFFDVNVAIRKCVLRNNRLICYLTYEYIGSAPKLVLTAYKGDTKMIDEYGNVYQSSLTTIANNSTAVRGIRYDLYRGIVVESTLEFEVGKEISMIRFLQVANDKGFDNIPVIK
jgi:hypothetical protein